MDLTEGIPSEVPSLVALGRNDGAIGGFPLNVETVPYQVTAVAYFYGTNVYYNVVLVNTNFAGTNLTATVGFSYGGFAQDLVNIPTPEEEDAYEAIVQIAEPVYDVISGQTVTNGIYLIDDGAILPEWSWPIMPARPTGTGEAQCL